MKLNKLIIDNIASIEHAEIDFDAAPLADEPVFLICGATGAGKSTILDSICLALYNQVPRLENAPSDVYADRQSSYKGKNKDGGNLINVNDPRMLLRRGATECSVQLTFTDDNNRRYTARWGCHHAHRKISGQVSDVEWELAEGNTVLVNRKRDVRDAIEKVVGMNFEQFRRTTMLAQGEFARFLSSSADSKSEILEKLTGTDNYSRIGAAIALRTRTVKEQMDQINTRLNATILLTPDETADITNRLNESNAAIERERGREQSITAQLAVICEINRLSALVESKSAQLDQNVATLNSAEAIRQQADIDLWDTTAPLRTSLAMAREHAATLAREELTLTDSSQYVRAKGHLAALKAHLTETRGTINHTTGQRETLARLSQMFDNLPLIRDNARRHDANLKTLTALRASIKKCSAEIDTLDMRQASLQKQLDETEAQRNCLRGRLTDANNELAALNPEAAERRLSEAAATLQLTENAHNLMVALKRSADTLQSVAAECSELDKELQLAIKHKDDCEAASAAASHTLDETERLYNRQKETTTDYLNEVRATLTEGSDCPLCGQRITRLTSTETFVSLLAPVRQKLDQDRAGAELQLKLLSDAKARHSAIARQLKLSEKRRTGAATQFETDHSAALSNSLIPRVPNNLDLAVKQLASHRKVARLAFENATATVGHINRLRTETGTLQQQLDRHTDNLQKQTASLAATFQQLTAAHGRLTATQSDINRLTTENNEIEQQATHDINSLLQTVGTLTLPMKPDPHQPGSLATVVESMLTRFNNLSEQLNKLTTEATTMAEAVERCTVAENQILQSRAAWASTTAEATPPSSLPPAAGVVSEWEELKSDVDLHNQRIESARSLLASANQTIETFKIKHGITDTRRIEQLQAAGDSSIELWRKQLADTRAAIKQLTADIAATNRSIKSLESQKPGLTAPELTLQLEAVKTAIETNLTLKGSLEERLRAEENARRENSSLLRRLDDVRLLHERWNRLNQLFGSSDGKRMRNIAQSWILEQLTHHANHYLRQLSPRYELVTQPGLLTLLVRDNDAGGDLRPATNLSGGESFVVSLALALGLPSLSGRVMAMDIIFIDEGFGSLDTDFRNTVIDTLERLHNLGGKRVGLISHVEALRERIAVKIEVSRRTETLSEVNIYRS